MSRTRIAASLALCAALVAGVLGHGVKAVAGETCTALQQSLDLNRCGSTVRVTHPRIMKAVTPRYPRWLRAQAVHRRVGVCVLVADDGRANRVMIVAHSGYPALDEAAAQAARATRFIPGTIDGLAQPMAAQLDYRFDVP